MAEATTIARPYAEAAFRIAEEANAITPWADALDRLAQAATLPQVDACLLHPGYTSTQKTDVLLAFLEDNCAKDPLFLGFLKVLADSRRLSLLPAIARSFELLKAQAEGTLNSVIYSAFGLTTDEVETLRPHLEKVFCRKLRLTVEICQELIGGIRVVAGDQVYDASVQGKLHSMSTQLRH